MVVSAERAPVCTSQGVSHFPSSHETLSLSDLGSGSDFHQMYWPRRVGHLALGLGRPQESSLGNSGAKRVLRRRVSQKESAQEAGDWE